MTTIQDYPTHPKVVQDPYWTDCLVLLQQDQVAAVSTDDAILYGLEAQDPFTKVVGPELTDEPYGLAMSKQHPDFVRFVNAVLAQERVRRRLGGQLPALGRPAGRGPAPRAVRRLTAPPRAPSLPRGRRSARCPAWPNRATRLRSTRARMTVGHRSGEHFVTPVTRAPRMG